MPSNPRYTMLDSRDIRCTRCGYENDPQFRFCGMCGASLRPLLAEDREEEANATAGQLSAPMTEPDRFSSEPMPVEPLLERLTAVQNFRPEPLPSSYSPEVRNEFYPEEPVHGQRTPVSVSGPSFLGLSEGSDRGVEYLLDDEPHPGRMRAIVGFLLLLAVCAGGIFYWRKAGYPWPSRLTSATSPATTSDASGQNANSLPSEVAPATENREIADKPKTSAGDSSVAQATKGPATTTPNEVSIPPKEIEQQGLGNSKAIGNEAPEAKEAPEIAEKTESPSPSAVQKVAPAPTADVSKPRRLNPSADVGTVSNPEQDNLYLDGQKYLYGRGGARQNCALAQQNLLASAKNDNSKAESTLGTMYATGHCVPRDIPLAYRWFARALHADPNNTRLEKDAEIMWNQMTPAERQIALRSR